MATGPLFWAMRQTPGNSVAKLILIGICDQVPDRGDGSVLIALNDLAVFGCCTIRTVRTCVDRLREAGLLLARRTVVVDENGRAGWIQFFPLFEGNPLQRGLLGEIDWDQPVEIESRELRNFISQAARAKAPDAIHNVGKGARVRHLSAVDNSRTSRSVDTRKELPGLLLLPLLLVVPPPLRRRNMTRPGRRRTTTQGISASCKRRPSCGSLAPRPAACARRRAIGHRIGRKPPSSRAGWFSR